MTEDKLEQARRELRAWTERPPLRSAEAARQQILAAIGARPAVRASGGRWKLAAAMAMVVAALVSAVAVLGPRSPGEGPRAVPAVLTHAVSTSALVVYELHSGTRLYVELPGASAEMRTKP